MESVIDISVFDFSFFGKLVLDISLFISVGFSDVGLSVVGFSNIGLALLDFPISDNPIPAAAAARKWCTQSRSFCLSRRAPAAL